MATFCDTHVHGAKIVRGGPAGEGYTIKTLRHQQLSRSSLTSLAMGSLTFARVREPGQPGSRRQYEVTKPP
jgi:hypothetical protein